MNIVPSDTLAADFGADLLARLDGGSGPAKLKIYTGVQPAKPDVAPTGGGVHKLLGTLTCTDPSGTFSGRRFTFANITQDAAADDGGTATWGRFEDSAGVAVLDVDISVTGGSGFLQLNNVIIVAGGPISVTSCYVDF